MIYIALIVSLILTLFSIHRSKGISSPSFIFNAVWTFVYLFTLVNLSGFFPVSDSVAAILIAGQVFFNIGTSFSKQVRLRGVTLSKSFALNKNIFIVEIALLILMLPFVIKVITGLGKYGFTMQRYIFATNQGGFFSSFERVFFIYTFVFPMNKAVCLLEITNLLKVKKVTGGLILSIIGIIFETLITAGRFAIVDIVFCFIMVFILSGTKIGQRKSDRRLKRIVVRTVIVVICAVAIVSASRTKRDSNPFLILFSNVTDYFTIGPRLLDIALNNPESWGLHDWGMGGYLFAGLLEIVRLLLAIIGVPINVTYFGDAQSVAGLYHVISSQGQSANAFPTMYYYFIRDFSWIGICVVPLVLGFISKALYMRASRYNEANWLALKYAYFMLLILYSSCWWQAIRPEYWATFIWMVILHRLFAIDKETGLVQI